MRHRKTQTFPRQAPGPPHVARREDDTPIGAIVVVAVSMVVTIAVLAWWLWSA